MVFGKLAIEAEKEFEQGGLEAAQHDLEAGVLSMRQVRKGRERKRLEEEMRQAERIGDTAKIAELSRQFNEV